MKSSSRKIEKTLAWIANIILISMVVLMYTGFFDRLLEGMFLTPEFIRFTSSSLVETFLLHTRMEYYRMIEIFIQLIKFSILLSTLISLLATFNMKHRIFSGVLFLFLALVFAGMATEVAFPVYLLYIVVAFMLFIRKG
jgi:hypothetical protein